MKVLRLLMITTPVLDGSYVEGEERASLKDVWKVEQKDVLKVNCPKVST